MRANRKIIIPVIVFLSVAFVFVGLEVTNRLPLSSPATPSWQQESEFDKDEARALAKRFLPYVIDGYVTSSDYYVQYQDNGKWWGRCKVEWIQTYKINNWITWYFYERSETLEIISGYPYYPKREIHPIINFPWVE